MPDTATARAPLPPASLIGQPAPWITLPTTEKPLFHLHTVAGRYLLLLFVGDGKSPAAREALDAMARQAGWADIHNRAIFTITTGQPAEDVPEAIRRLAIQFIDAEGIAHASYGVKPGAAPRWFLLDPTMRTLGMARGNDTAALFQLMADLPAPELHSGCATPAPVLVVPRIFEPEFCKMLIGYYEAQGGRPSGFMRQVGERTKLIHDPSHKLRQDCEIEDDGIIAAVQARIRLHLVPEIKKAFQFEATRMERYIIARYDTDYGGHFRPHRDNTTAGTAHRRFAVSLNLNGDYVGGDLRLAEYGPQTYRAPPGGAVVFSCSLLHEATPMEKGVRYVFLPFLYDDANAELRKRNASLIDFGDERDAAMAEG